MFFLFQRDCSFYFVNSTHTNIEIDVDVGCSDDSDSSDPDLASTCSASTSASTSAATTTPHRKRKRESSSNTQFEESILKYLSAQQEEPAEDSVDVFFRSMAAACKKLPDSEKSRVKFEIHKIIFEAEERFHKK